MRLVHGCAMDDITGLTHGEKDGGVLRWLSPRRHRPAVLALTEWETDDDGCADVLRGILETGKRLWRAGVHHASCMRRRP